MNVIFTDDVDTVYDALSSYDPEIRMGIFHQKDWRKDQWEASQARAENVPDAVCIVSAPRVEAISQQWLELAHVAIASFDGRLAVKKNRHGNPKFTDLVTLAIDKHRRDHVV